MTRSIQSILVASIAHIVGMMVSSSSSRMFRVCSVHAHRGRSRFVQALSRCSIFILGRIWSQVHLWLRDGRRSISTLIYGLYSVEDTLIANLWDIRSLAKLSHIEAIVYGLIHCCDIVGCYVLFKLSIKWDDRIFSAWHLLLINRWWIMLSQRLSWAVFVLRGLCILEIAYTLITNIHFFLKIHCTIINRVIW
jgi:hypothetical protein